MHNGKKKHAVSQISAPPLYTERDNKMSKFKNMSKCKQNNNKKSLQKRIKHTYKYIKIGVD